MSSFSFFEETASGGFRAHIKKRPPPPRFFEANRGGFRYGKKFIGEKGTPFLPLNFYFLGLRGILIYRYRRRRGFRGGSAFVPEIVQNVHIVDV